MRFDTAASTAARESRAAMSEEVLMTEAEAAAFLRLSRRSLQRYRQEGGGPAVIRLGPRRVAYALRDLRNWVSAHTSAKADL